MKDIEALNQKLFLWINAGPDSPAWLIDCAIVIADWLIFLVPIMLIIVWVRGETVEPNLALKACIVTFCGIGLNQIIRWLWPLPRPSMIGLGSNFLPHPANSSFPSDHLAVFTGIDQRRFEIVSGTVFKVLFS